MSNNTKTAIYEILTGGNTLTALLGVDENDDPAVFNATYNQITAEQVDNETDSLYPIVTYRQADDATDSRVQGSRVSVELWDFEVWARTESGTVVPAILAEIRRLLHHAAVNGGGDYVFESLLISQSPDNYNSGTGLHFGLARYRLVVRNE